MGKPMGQANAYLLGFAKGPVKIGVTSRHPRKRLGAARRELKLDYWDSEGLEVFAIWPHRHAYMIEKLTHMYLQDHHKTGEWFNVSVYKVRRAVNQVIRLLDTVWKTKVTSGNWFVRHGIPESAVIKCFGRSSQQVMSEWNGRVFDDWDRQKAARDASGETARREARLLEVRAKFERHWRNKQARERRLLKSRNEAA